MLQAKLRNAGFAKFPQAYQVVVSCGATVTLTNEATNEARTASSNGLGYYSFQLLPPATYRFQVSMSGFSSFVVNRIPLDVGQVVAQNVTLHLGQSTQTVTVTESGPQIESESSSLGTVLGNNSIMDLPTNGRNGYSFATLVPGVRAPDLFSGVAYGNYNDQFLSVNGSRVKVSMFLLDAGVLVSAISRHTFVQSVALAFHDLLQNQRSPVQLYKIAATSLLSRM